MSKGARVPKFGDWKSGDKAPSYTVFFDKAREDRGGGKMINPNDPQENPTMFPDSTGTRTKPAAGDQSPHRQPHGGRGGQRVDRSPLHPQHQKGNASPGGEGKNSNNSSHGASAGRSRMKPANPGDETPDRGAAVPKFGAWNDEDPRSADSFTGIFQRVRDERNNAPIKSPRREGYPSFSSTPRKPYTEASTKCSCFPWFGK